MPGKKANKSKKKWREKWYKEHPGWTHKAWAEERKKIK